MTGPISAYRALVDRGDIRPDPAQQLAMEKLQSLFQALKGYRPKMGDAGGGWLSRFGIGAKPKVEVLRWTPPDAVAQSPKQGLYIFGEVGRGKSMLMDMFYENATLPGKRRVHFHEFMRDIHAAIHAWRQAGAKGDDPIPQLVSDLADNAWLLCLDELQVTDIADAMIVGRLFKGLMDQGVVIVITSNRAPKDLYKDGLQRERFLPFIQLIEEQLDILELNSERDYRLGRKKGLKVFHAPLGAASDAALDAAFDRLTGGEMAKPDQFEVNGRIIPVPLAASGVARFDFKDLCGKPLGASDYLALAARYHALVLSNVPLLSPENKDEARRFVTLIDALYEAKVTLVCSAQAEAQVLYPTGIGSFEFQRTVSRLMEMQAEDYLARQHLEG